MNGTLRILFVNFDESLSVPAVAMESIIFSWEDLGDAGTSQGLAEQDLASVELLHGSLGSGSSGECWFPGTLGRGAPQPWG